MNLLVLLASISACALAQALLPAWNFLCGAKPPVLLGGVLYYALSRPRGLALAAAVLAGILQDALDLIPLGFSTWTFLVVCSLVTHYQNKIFGTHWFTHMTIGALASGGMVLCLYALLTARGVITRPLTSALIMALGVMILGLAVIPVVFKCIHRLDLRLGNIREGGWQ